MPPPMIMTGTWVSEDILRGTLMQKMEKKKQNGSPVLMMKQSCWQLVSTRGRHDGWEGFLAEQEQKPLDNDLYSPRVCLQYQYCPHQ